MTRSPTTTADPADLYLARLGTDHSRRTARSALTTVAGLLGVDAIDWSAVTYPELAMVRAGLGGYSVAWGNTCWSVVRQVTLEARRLGLVDQQLVNDVLALPRFRGSSGRLGRDVAGHEVAALLGACDPGTVAGRRDGALVALLAAGGLRCSETANAAAADWDSDAARLVVPCGKGRSVRIVPMPSWAAERIDDWLDGHPGGGMLLRSIDRWENLGTRLSPRGVAYLLAGRCDAAGIETLCPHALRAKRITEVLDASDPLVAQRLAGHAQVTTTARYDRRGLDHLAGVVEGMEQPGRAGRLRVVA
jgi:site-specific recombinase XerC